MPEITLSGCTPEPLMSYLKALGILRLVAEQKDPDAKGCWRDGVFVLHASLDNQSLVTFFLNEYRPTPIIVPWSGSDFFGVDSDGKKGPFKKTPTSTKVIEAFLASTGDRLDLYRDSLRKALAVMANAAIDGKKQLEDKKLKSKFIARLRSDLPAQVACWVDACALMEADKPTFNSLLGSGGGSDGNTHFSDNFMQNLWDALPDFDFQREGEAHVLTRSKEQLRSALFKSMCTELVSNRTSSLFDAGAVGGPNAGQGFERASIGNPWAFILCLEGALVFSGSVNRRQSAGDEARASFPFQVGVTQTTNRSIAEKESAGREIWLPLWRRPSGLAELSSLFSEGRASVREGQVARGVDFARAVVSLGVDRGIDAFERFAIVRGRVGGENYNTSASLGLFPVRARPEVDLVREVDPWLERFRRAASDDKAPPRFRSALRRIEEAIFGFCQHGGPSRFGEILCALGRAERELSTGERFRKEKKLPPICGLSPQWLGASDDQSIEFEIALALSGIWDRELKVGPLRANLEPAEVWRGKSGGAAAKWAEAGNAVVWTNRDLASNLSGILERRLLDGKRLGCTGLPLSFHRGATLAAISAFLHGETDDERIAELLWGMILIDHSESYPAPRPLQVDAPPLPRPFALLRLSFLPNGIEMRAGEVSVKPEARVLGLLRGGRTQEACAIAARRLRASGLNPMPHARGTSRDDEWKGALGAVSASRLSAALLIPVSKSDVKHLVKLVSRPETVNEEAAR